MEERNVKKKVPKKPLYKFAGISIKFVEKSDSYTVNFFNKWLGAAVDMAIEEDDKLRLFLDVIKERLRLTPSTNIRVNNKGLSYTELRAMLTLKSKIYSDLTTDQLVSLRNKVLFRFEDEIDYHISQWQERLRQIKLVAEERGVSLETNNNVEN